MLVSRQYIIAKGSLQFAVPVKIIRRVKVGAIVSVFKGSIGKIMLDISIPVIPKRSLEILIILPVLDYVYHLVHSPAL